MLSSLLPPNSSLFERCLAEAMAFDPQVKSTLEEIPRAKFITRPSSWLPYLIDEYGLQELSPYFSNPYTLLDQGLKWQNIRGSLAAIDRGLEWLQMTARFQPAWTGRAWWNSFQLYFDQLPERTQLEAIEAIVRLSKSLRSDFRRGVNSYDVQAMEGNMSRLDDSLLEYESGVCITAGGTLFSFGRTTEIEHVLLREEGTLIGNWIDDGDEELSWDQIDYPWDMANFPWCSVKKHERDMLMAEWFHGRTLYLVLRDSQDGMIGFRRCYAVAPVEQALEGVYSHSSGRFQPSPMGTALLVAARTDFGDVDGKQAASFSVLVHATPAENIALGKLWLEPDELKGGVEILKTPINIPLRADVREQFKILLRF
ncbi:phage tail protein [Bartonella vinsonii]|uniref:Phage protein n=1 Tax=Bartonella vinsonii subsp. berkhoffii str. Tweed TaxID=1094502 RepID=N6UW13_BARVB|nr:phage tail protein [Bartonella vinsonii]AGF75849.1 phage protein [Bartonella vinsonii subsp. berkhoffii str. Winnie]ENN93169.1 phage protein [Bartonella vinsonii subsp. berkhoffii str. Tweed]ENN94263.1 phage protein [Bartonella vinsonii subsp. berkhoffii str. Tweed]ENN94681.1 phage protein [Bartonella vinsonii subsp. berkhoffii str. Tweed]ENN94780.1 phage protein [Bartonella vinsonii subsp. berkhoffii str. Tweed]